VLFCNARSKLEGRDTVYGYTGGTFEATFHWCRGLDSLTTDLSGNGYRLPTEGEWEYACRAGTTTHFYWGNAADPATVSRYAWYDGNSNSTPHTVGRKRANAFDLYDMAGNVWEWCNDWGETYIFPPAGDTVDPTGLATGTRRIMRGGSWVSSYIENLASGFRDKDYPENYDSHVGFRCVRRQ
jgi:formylglycine-generating enzyme required for sulfatase activity